MRFARINGSGPYRFIFDTGAPMLLVNERVATDARILPRGFQRPFFTPLGDLGAYRVRSINLGRAQQTNVLSDVWNHPTVEALSRAFGPFEGLMGFPFFAHYQMTIDYQSKTMTLIPSPFQPVDTREKMTRRLSDVEQARVYAPRQSMGIVVAKDAKDTAAGVTITTVMPQSPAERAHILAGDRLLTLNGRWTDSIEDCYAALCGVDSSRAVSATILRGGKEINLRIKVEPAI